jgi:hypothetical protein
MKSHDFHIWIERILSAIIRGYVPEHVWLALSKLSYFFRQLCAKELFWTVVAYLERLAPMLLCKLEKIFPLGFFNPMQHLILHLPYEERMGGPCSDVGAIQLSGTITRGTLKAPNSQLVTPISIKLQRPDGCD